MNSPIYRYPWLYSLVMRTLYFPHYQDRYCVISTAIPDGSQVADLCAGDCKIYQYELSSRSIDYTAFDISPAFLRNAKRLSIPSERLDIKNDEIPSADVIMMLCSLYQFLPEAGPVVEKMIQAARSQVIISEPVRNMAQSSNLIFRWIARSLTRVEAGVVEKRFTRDSLQTLLSPLGFQEFILLPGGRDMLAVLKK